MDFVESILGLRDELVPPRRKIFVGEGDFKKIGQEFLRYFVEFGQLKPDERVLDVGCGIGRMAVPLTGYLSSRGEYQGIDIVQEGISWCQRHISPKFSNFYFQLSDVYNGNYNPAGRYRAQDYKFPFVNEYFDFVFLTSVFTHMLPGDLENYLSEISRVLRPEGRCLATFFLLNAESRSFISSGSSTLAFKYEIEEGLTIDRDNPESALAYEEVFIRRLYEKYGLQILAPIHPGSWCGRKGFVSYQDLVFARRKV
jgi:SAM-dependent methyltransferase